MQETARKKDKLSSLAWLVVAILICFGSIRLSIGELHSPGPGLFSFVAGAILGVLSFALFLKSLKGPAENDRRTFWSNPQRGLKMTYVLIALILYTIGMSFLGFFLSTILFLGFLLRSIDRQRCSLVIIVSILGAISSYGIFEYWLNVQLPQGILGF